MGIKVKDKLYVLETQHTTYAFFEDEEGVLVQLYWGRRICRIEDFDLVTMTGEQGFHPNIDKKREECSSFGGMRYKETSLKVSYEDGVRDFRYRVESVETKENHLVICLKDIFYPLQVKLHYLVHEKEDIIEKWREIENTGEGTVALEKAFSGEFTLPGENYRIINSNGMWNDEFKWREDTLKSGKKVYEDLRGATAHVAVPGFMIHQNADENQGEVWFGTLGYSGNFKVVAEQTPYEYLNIQIGINDTDFTWNLKGKEKFETPVVYAGYSDCGLGKASCILNHFAHSQIMPERTRKKPLQVLYNSWEAVDFHVTCEKQMKLAKKAAGLGVELFVIDDGWFGKRDSDHRGLGDWYVNREKFPDGLTPLIDEVKKLGMDFGIWIEPEMVNEDSDLYRQHPDWIYRYPTRQVLEGRYQYMLDMTNPEVCGFIIEFIDKLLSENEISYVKWDMNRAMGECASAYNSKDEFKSIYFRHVQGFYQIIQKLRALHPDVEFEACASGGGRVDYGCMKYFDEFWTSDNTDPLDRLLIQEFYSLYYPTKYMRAWITDAADNEFRQVPFEFKIHCAMCGALGIGTDLFKADTGKKEMLKEAVCVYKKIRKTIQFGDIYRISSFRNVPVHAVEYNGEEQTVLFVFQQLRERGIFQRTVKLRNLDEDKVYCFEYEGRIIKKSGSYLMYHGILLSMNKDFQSYCIVFEPEK